jgi:Uma2 family endonuclease
MTIVIAEPRVERDLIEHRRARGVDRFDEVWERVYFMAPAPNIEHQGLVARLTRMLMEVVDDAGLGQVYPAVNVTDRDDWQQNFRVPDITVFLDDTNAENLDTRWRGPVDFLVEVISPHDRAREKMPFYEKLGVREVLLVDRDPWQLELYRHENERFRPVGVSRLPESLWLPSDRVPIRLRLVDGERRPAIEVEQLGGDGRWLI